MAGSQGEKASGGEGKSRHLGGGHSHTALPSGCEYLLSALRERAQGPRQQSVLNSFAETLRV